MDDRQKRLKDKSGWLISVLHFVELPAGFRTQWLKSTKLDNYKYLRVTIEDVDSGEAISQPLYTFWDPQKNDQLVETIIDVLQVPELLKASVIAEWVGFGDDRLKNVTYWDIVKSQLLGGAPRGMREETKVGYRQIAKDYHTFMKKHQHATKEDFLRNRSISRTTLGRALRFVSKDKGPNNG